MKTKNQTAAPALQTAAPRIPCFDVKPKRNSKKIQDRARQKRMAAILAPLKMVLKRIERTQ
jgi:hypothetical protein